MKNSKISLFILGIFAISFSFTSCDQDNVEKTNNNITTASDYTSILGIMDLAEIDDATADDGLKSAAALDYVPCFEVTVHDNGTAEFWPRSWTFSYTNEDCVDFFGNTKLGAVNVLLTGYWKNEGSSRTITYEDFTINGNKLEGTRTILNTGLNDMQNLTFERSCVNASYSQGDTATMTWESNRNVEMINGYETFIAADDEYMVAGGASGVNFEGKAFTASITEELHYMRCSMFPVSGIVTIDIDGGSSIYINYGEGTCDNVAEVTIDDLTTEITLGHRN
ncbi:MAG: hypothetical protein K9H49_03720 [Bacteroidales bacterium]|nr:hypothetical protein [Bacteroidales bacterium]MCF8389399.1 hypothetical protein [Bacteroidales bacterium]